MSDLQATIKNVNPDLAEKVDKTIFLIDKLQDIYLPFIFTSIENIIGQVIYHYVREYYIYQPKA